MLDDLWPKQQCHRTSAAKLELTHEQWASLTTMLLMALASGFSFLCLELASWHGWVSFCLRFGTTHGSTEHGR